MAYVAQRATVDEKKNAADIFRILKRLFPDAGIMLRYRNSWELMVAVQLSAQCTDKKVNEVTEKLFKKYRTLDAYIRADPREFERDIFQTGFYKNKTRNILAAATMVKERFGGRVPNTMEDILKLPGVARKTANVVLGNAFGVVQGIAVDTHVKRLARQLGLTKQTDPEKVEKDLMMLFPKTQWISLTYRLIEYGRTYSPARKKNHAGEPLEAYYL